MGWRPWSLFFKWLRITLGLACIGWGIISSFPLLMWLPGGIWTILFGLAILAIDFPWAKRLLKRINNRLERAAVWFEKKFPRIHRLWKMVKERAESRSKGIRASLKKKFPKFYDRIIAPVGKVMKRAAEKLRLFMSGGKED